MFNDAIKMTGNLKLVLTDENGNIKQEEEVKNLVVTVGKNYIASRMKDATATAMTHMEVGTSSTVFSVINKGAADTLGITWTVTVN